MVVILIDCVWQAVGFLWGYYIQQFGATIIIVAAGFIVSCFVSNGTIPFTHAVFLKTLILQLVVCIQCNCNNRSCLYIFPHSSDTMYMNFHIFGTKKIVWWYFIPPSRLPTLIVNYCNSIKRSSIFKAFRLKAGDVGFSGWRKSRQPGEKPLKQGENQQQTQVTYEIRLEFNLCHLSGRQSLSPLHHLVSQNLSPTWACSCRYYYRSSSVFLM